MKIKYQIVVGIEVDGEMATAGVLRMVEMAFKVVDHNRARVDKIRIASMYVVHEEKAV